MPGVVMAGTHSGCGKTTITLGVLAALQKKGLTVQSFKAGPDFIDTGLHRIITGRPSRNLDLWMCGEEYVKGCFHKHSTDIDISVVEGVMGMYDGDFSTAKLSELLDLPVIIVVDAYGMAESAGAVVKGFVEFGMRNAECRTNNQESEIRNPKSEIPFAGVIFNRVASENHYRRLKNSIRDVEVLGYLPRNLDFEIPHRHLGLIVAEENPIADENIQRLADAVSEHINIDWIIDSSLSCCHSHESGNPDSKDNGFLLSRGRYLDSCFRRNDKAHSPIHPSTHSPVIAIAYDKAFCFYYEDNLDLLRDAGAEIITFSPVSDSRIPGNADVLCIGGGYPELHAKELSQNTSMLESIYNWAGSGRPIYAECGGLMYLSKGIHDFEGNFFKMAGVFPFETIMKKGRSHLGYREIILKDNCIIGKKGDRLRGHEFHYSEIKERTQNTVCHSVLDTESREGMDSRLRTAGMTGYGIQARIYSVKDNSGQNLHDEGYRFRNTLASYIHIHFGSNPDIAGNFIDFIKEQ